MTVSDAPHEAAAAAATPEQPLTLPDIKISSQPTRAVRLASLDVFRGITIAAMLLVNNPGIGSTYAPLRHADWHGWTVTDLIFPFFLFIVGVAIPFSFSKRRETESRWSLLGHVWTRALALFLLGALLHAFPFRGVTLGTLIPDGFLLLGALRVATYVIVALGFVALLVPWPWKKLNLLLPPIVGVLLLGLGFAIHYANRHALANGLPADFSFGNGIFSPETFRIPGVLQRIGVCYGVAGTIALFAGWRTVLGSIIILCTLYSALMLRGEYPGHVTGSLTKEDNLARKIDEAVFGSHVYAAYPDPEGILSTLPAIATVLLGVLVGLSLRSSNRLNVEKCANLLAAGVGVTSIGVLLDWWLMPINKQLWTPSFTFFTAGLGMLTLGAIFWLADLRGRRAWALPFTIYGMNAIAAFVFSGIVVRIASLIEVTHPAGERKVTLVEYCRIQAAEGVRTASDSLQQLWPYFPAIDTPGNTSLAYSLAFVLAILLLMSVLYLFKIFIKV